MKKDYYKILGVNTNSNLKEIRSAYFKLAKKYHPDVNPKGEKKFKEINEAYEVLSNPLNRIAFDKDKNLIDAILQCFVFRHIFVSFDLFLPMEIRTEEVYHPIDQWLDFRFDEVVKEELFNW